MSVRILIGDARERMRDMLDGSVHCIVTSPPYFGLRDYGVAGQIGLEATPDAFVATMVEVFRECRRVLRDDGTLWLNLGDSYASSWACHRRNVMGNGSLENGKRESRPNRLVGGLKEKDLIGIPWRVAFALQADGWYLRSDIIWHKPNPMPESVTDRPTSAHEHVFLLSKRYRYYYDAEAVKEAAVSEAPSGNGFSGRQGGARNLQMSGGNGTAERWQPGVMRNLRNVWTVATEPYRGAHFATFPPSLIEPCIKAGSPEDGTVLDPFGGAGTTGLVADRLGRNVVLIEINPEYAALAKARLFGDSPLFAVIE